MTGPEEVVEDVVVRDESRDAIARLQAGLAQDVRDTAGALFELAVGFDELAVVEDDGGAVGVFGGVGGDGEQGCVSGKELVVCSDLC